MVDFREGSLYKYYRAELDEILKHKWLESEKMDHDIGFERALFDWIKNHRSEYKKHQKINF
jgi:hypothetical protein